MNRTKFFKKVKVDGTAELDFLDNNLTKLSITRTPSYYRLNSIDRKRPDIISYKNYNTVNYWWIICLVSGIEDPFFDLTIGRIVTIVNLLDVYDFYRTYMYR